MPLWVCTLSYFLKRKKEKLLKEKKSKIKNSGQIYDSIFKENEFLLPSQLIFVSDLF